LAQFRIDLDVCFGRKRRRRHRRKVFAWALHAPASTCSATLTISGPSGTFGDDSVTCDAAAPCSFTRVFEFVTPAGFNLASADVKSNYAGDNLIANLDFSSVTLNGVEFETIATGQQEFRNLLNQSLTTGATNVLRVSGSSGGNAAFSGTLSFASVAAVPEPGTWALMLLGFGAVGSSMRRQRKDAARPLTA
jgi:hypothetical protein